MDEEPPSFMAVAFVIVGWLLRRKLREWWRQHQWKRNVRSAMSMKKGFGEAVAQQKAAFLREQHAAASSFLLNLQQPPASGLYKAEIHEYTIADAKSREVFHPGSDVSSILSVQFTLADNDCESATCAAEDVGSWVMRGSRANTLTVFYAIEQGLFCGGVRSGQQNCYWVEQRTADRLLVVGTWSDFSFEGEWISCTGMRGRYTAYKTDYLMLDDQNENKNDGVATAPTASTEQV